MKLLSVAALVTVILFEVEHADAMWYYEDGAPSLDSCDYLQWRTCETDADCEFDAWRQGTFAGPGTSVPGWESDQSYSNFASYSCVSPSAAHNMDGCEAKRCVPDVASAFACQTDTDCPDGQTCSDDGQCVSCGSDPAFFSAGACHQVATHGCGGGGCPSYVEGQSGCAGDHCLHICAYDTQCVRITANTTEVDVTATHNQLPGRLNLTQADREALMRPSACGRNDAGTQGGGMRCAAMIHRTITSRSRTPEEVRDRDLDVVELSVMKFGGDDQYENYVTFDPDDLDNRALRVEEDGGRGHSVGYIVPPEARTPDGATVGTGVLAHQPWGREVHPWERRGLIQCDVRYADDAPLHTTLGGTDVLDDVDRGASI